MKHLPNIYTHTHKTWVKHTLTWHM